VEARRAYKQCCKAKKREFQHQRQLQLLETYFGPNQKDYWQAFFGAGRPLTPLTDVGAWTQYFRALLGAPMAPLSLTPADAALRDSLYAVSARGSAEDMEELNAPVSYEEAQSCMGLPSGKAADLSGMTGEMLSVAGSELKVAQESQPVCRPAIECARWLLQAMLSEASLPASMCVSKLAPVPKDTAPAALMDPDKHRGISISPVFTRLLDRLVNQRLERVVSRLRLRAPTQCGFRAGHGTLDAVYALDHLTCAARQARRLLFVVFVDFKKAFDRVRRELLLERCRRLGIHGPFLAVLAAMYERVWARVAVGRDLGGVFATTSGTKQGSELSPILFGLFIELLHDLIRLKCPGAGPILDGLPVPDILYADDVALIAQSAAEAQGLMDVLDVFCRLFDMEVNMGPRKTCAVVFRRAQAKVPSGFRLLFRGAEVPVQTEYMYLGVRVHATKGLAGASDALAASGSKAMHALLTQCRRANLTQTDIKTRMFDVLVEPVLSYASHIWGPQHFLKRLAAGPLCTDLKAERVHASYLRILCGAGRGTSLDVLYRDMHRLPVVFHWVVLAVRWWNRMGAAHVDALGTLACCAWVEDVALAYGGYKDCWASRVLTTMTRLGLLQVDWRQQPLPWVQGLRWQEVEVQRALARLLVARWQGSSHPDPRAAPSRGVALCTHMAWVLPLDPAQEDLSRATAPPHTKVLGSFAVLRNYFQLRTGCAHLEVEQGRQGRRVERHRRLCRLCSGPAVDPAVKQAVLARTGTSDNVEDLKHFVLECPVYDTLRARCPALPASLYSQLDAPDSMTRVFGHADQSCLARTLFKMKARRAQLLQLPYPY
jgi:sorting nexin-29